MSARFVGRAERGWGWGFLRMESLRVEVRIKRKRAAYGRVDLLVTPVAGEGEQWVSAERVEEESL